MSDAGFRIRRACSTTDDVEALAAILIDCVAGGASVGFMAPVPLPKAVAFWEKALAAAERGERIILVAETSDGDVVGTVQVVLALPENQPHRGEVAKMLVRRDGRRRGAGVALLQAAETAAREAGRSLLVLDTASNGDAARLYARLGWQRVGEVPGYALWPEGGPCSTTYFYKQLR